MTQVKKAFARGPRAKIGAYHFGTGFADTRTTCVVEVVVDTEVVDVAPETCGEGISPTRANIDTADKTIAQIFCAGENFILDRLPFLVVTRIGS
jgi:hypothetical protein